MQKLRLGLLVLPAATCALLSPDAAVGQLRRIGPVDAFASEAVAVKDRLLIHTSQLLPWARNERDLVGRDDAEKQCDRVLERLQSALAGGGSSLKQAVKLNVYVTSDSAAATVRKRLAQKLGKQTRPAVSFVVTPLPHPPALVAMDAVAAVSSPQQKHNVDKSISAAVSPGKGRLIYISGQAERDDNLLQATRKTMQSLHRTLSFLKAGPKHVLRIKTFFQPMKEVDAVDGEISRHYSKDKAPPVSHVQWTSKAIEIEMVAFVPYTSGEKPGDDPVRYVTPPWMKSSPVFSRVAVVESRELVFVSGLYGRKDGSGEQQVRDIFGKLKRITGTAGGGLKHLVKATYYVADSAASRELNRLRPEFYDPKRPPAASKAPVAAVGMPGRTITLDMIAVPKLSTRPASADDRYLETLVELQSPKKKSQRAAEGGEKHVAFRCWLPEDVKTIRGVTFNPFYTKAVSQKHWQAACRHWGFGILAANFFGAKQEEFRRLIDDALATFAKQSGRPELAKAKLCPVGMSAGAGMSVNVARLMPHRVIAVGPVCLEVGPRSPESMRIPMLTVFGERDGQQYEKLMAKLPDVRAQGARFGIAVQWRRRHEFARANNLLLPLFDAAIRRRLGRPGEPLRDFDEMSGWLGNVSQWRDGVANVAPAATYQGDKAKACWFPDETTARAWQAFVTREPVLELKRPPGLGDGQTLVLHHVDQPITVQMKTKGKVALSAPVEVYAGGRPLGQLQAGKLEIQFKQPGVYPLYLKAADANGSVLLSRPNTILVTLRN